MTYRVVFSPRVRDHLLDLHAYISVRASPAIAGDFTASIIDFCLGLANFPNRGTGRADLRPGLRTIAYRRRVTVAYHVDESIVSIVGVFYGGQDVETILSDTTGPECDA